MWKGRIAWMECVGKQLFFPFFFFLKEVSLLIKSLPSHTYAVKCKRIPSTFEKNFIKRFYQTESWEPLLFHEKWTHTADEKKKEAPEQASRWTSKWNCFYSPVISCSCWPQFFLKESHLGQNRATCSLQQLSDLNPRVRVSAHTGPLEDDLLLQFQVRQALNVAPNCAQGFMLTSIKITKLEDCLLVYFCLIISIWTRRLKFLKITSTPSSSLKNPKSMQIFFHVKSVTAGQKLFSISLYIIYSQRVCVHRSFHISTSQFCKFVCWTTISPKILLGHPPPQLWFKVL